MPSFSVQFPNLQVGGPVFEARIAPRPSSQKRRKSKLAEPVTVTAMIDTGASTTVLKEGVAEALGLEPTAVRRVHSATSADVPCGEFALRIFFKPNIYFDVEALELPMHGPHIECLIGRDVLSKCVFIYLGSQNQFVVSV